MARLTEFLSSAAMASCLLRNLLSLPSLSLPLMRAPMARYAPSTSSVKPVVFTAQQNPQAISPEPRLSRKPYPDGLALLANPSLWTLSSAQNGSPQNARILPLTVKQISQALQHPFDDTFIVDGADLNNATLVGMVLFKEEKSTDVSFVLDDGTGRVDVKCWIDGQDMHECIEMMTLQNGAYVRIYGHLRFFQGKRNVVAFSMRFITDFNEITFHFLECIYVHLYNLKFMGAQFAPGLTNTTAGRGNSFMRAPLPAGGAISGSYSQYMPSCAVSVGGSMDECQKRVQAIFEEPHSLCVEVGLHVDNVARRMGGFSRKQVKDAIEFLVNEGMIYSTIDDDHYRSTNS